MRLFYDKTTLLAGVELIFVQKVCDMRRLVFSFAVMCVTLMSSFSQDLPDPESLMHILGAESPEELDADELERLLSYVERPLKINDSSVDRLIASGLMSMYQAVSLVDYRERHGAVVSLSELAAIDGFSHESVNIIAPFITINSAVREVRSDGACFDLTSRAGCRYTDGAYTFCYGVKTKLEVKDRMTVSASASSSYLPVLTHPDRYSANITYEFSSFPLRFFAGDFNARFGQGLVLWNGMTMSGLPLPSYFMRTQTGLSGVFSFTGGNALTGIAADVLLKKFKISALLAAPGIKDGDASIMPALNMIWRGRNVQMGITHYCESGFSNERRTFMIEGMKTSTDMSASIRGTDLFMEVAYDWKNAAPAFIAGLSFPACDGVRLASMVRFYPSHYDSSWSGGVRSGTKCSNEYAASMSCRITRGSWVKIAGADGSGASVRRHDASFTADAAYYPVSRSGLLKSIQVKLMADWSWMLAEKFRMKFRLSERFRTWGLPFRTDARLDFTCFSSRFTITSRFNVLCCDKTGILAYLEGGYKDGKLSVFLRHGYFMIDDWDDRIYAYERDAPGSFNVPAFYGRGLWMSLTGTCRTSRQSKLYLRASVTGYPFMKKKKPGRAELKLQYVVSF